MTPEQELDITLRKEAVFQAQTVLSKRDYTVLDFLEAAERIFQYLKNGKV